MTTAPWQSLEEVSVQNERRDYDMTGGNAAVSSDSQAVFLIVQVNHTLERGQAVALYRETGGHFIDRILDPAGLPEHEGGDGEVQGDRVRQEPGADPS